VDSDRDSVERPDVILLNGTSSAGKSQLTLALQVRLPYVRFGIDDFVYERAPARWFDNPEGFVRVPHNGAMIIEYGSEALKLWRAYHRAVRACVDEGLGVVVDDAILTRELLDDWLITLSGVDVFFVGVHCAEKELIARERARRDRMIGSAVAAIDRVHGHAIYDLEVDSTTTPSSALAKQIVAGFGTRQRPSAFERMRGGIERVSE